MAFLFGAGYGSRTRLLGLGSRCTTDVRILHMKFSLPCSARQIREYSGSCAASVSLRIFFWLCQKLRCVASRLSVDGKMLAIEPRVHCGAHIPKRNAIHLDGISFWSRIRESNPPPRLGKPMYYRCTNPALHGSCVEFLDIIASFLQKSNRFLAKRKNRASGGRPGGIQQSLAPAGMASSSMTRWSFSSPFSLCTAESSMPHDSWPIIFLGGRLTMAASVLPTRASGS